MFALRRLLVQVRGPQSGNDNEFAIDGDVIHVDDVHDADTIDRLESLDPDLGIVYGHKILQPSVFTVPRFGTVGIHWGRVPDYRGKRCVFWEMYHGEDASAVTFQVLHEGIDTGEIIRQVPIPIDPSDRLSDVLDRIETEAATELAAIVTEYRKQEGDVETTPQERAGSLYTDPKLRHRVLFHVRTAVRRLLA